MSDSTIQAILATSGWETTIAPDIGQIGIQLSDGAQGWSALALTERTGLTPLLLEAAVSGMIRPALLGQPASPLQERLAQIGTLEERTTRVVQRPSADPARARRNFLHSLVGNEPEPPPEEIEETTQPLSLALRLAVQSALLQAVAQSQQVSLAELLTQTFTLPSPASAVPLQVAMGEADTAVFHLVQRRVGALQVSVPEDEIQTILQLNATKFLSYLRHLQEWVSDQAPRGYVPLFHLDLRGGLGKLYGTQAGRILGVLYSIEQAMASFSLRVQDPVLLDSFADYLVQMGKLRGYVDKRHLRLRLMAGGWLSSAEAVEAVIEAEAAHGVVLDVARFGGFEELMTAVRLCHEKKMPFVLTDETAVVDETLLTALALATQPLAVGCGVKTAVALHNQMQRTLAQLQTNTPSILPPT